MDRWYCPRSRCGQKKTSRSMASAIVNDENFIIDLSTVTMKGPDYSTIESTNEDIVQMIDFGI